MINRRKFLGNASLTFLASLLGLPGIQLPASASARQWKNWSGLLSCHPEAVMVPESEHELIRLLTSPETGTRHIRPVGYGHSFSPLIPTNDILLSLSRLSGLVSTESQTSEATFLAGTRMSDMGMALQDNGQAFINMADIDRQSLAGAISTSTHGTGADLGSLSSYVTGLTLVTPDGIRLECDSKRSPDIFQAARVSLGALGVITRIRLKNRETYRLKKTTWGEKTHSVLERAEELLRTHRHFEMFPMVNSDMAIVQTIDETSEALTDIPGPDTEGDETLRKLQEFGGYLPWLRRWLTNSAIEEMQPMSFVGESWQVLPSARNMKFNEMEYQIPLAAGPQCLKEILATIEKESVDIVFPLEYRYVKGDDVWMSMFNGRDSCSISVHHFADYDHRPYFDLIEPIFWKYEGRPHWGKIHTLSAKTLQPLYPHWDDFMSIRERLDPGGRMLNKHLSKLFFTDS
ncbi:MAG: FAD-binding protein [Gammaproteobacteria bacterium]|nr:FAD-binding protein [Gammaproteobacteria bacterium]